MTFGSIEHTTGPLHKTSFILYMGGCFFLLIHFLVLEDYELPKSASNVLSVPLTLESVRNSGSTSFHLSDNVLHKVAI